MSTRLYSVAASNHERLADATDAAEALRLVLAEDDFFADQKEIVVSRRDDVLRVSGKPKAAKAAPETAAPKGMVLVSLLADELGMTLEGIKYRMKKHGIKGQRIAGSGRPLAVTQKDADKLGSY